MSLSELLRDICVPLRQRVLDDLLNEEEETRDYRSILRIPLTEHVSNDVVVERMKTKKKLKLNIRMRKLKFL